MRHRRYCSDIESHPDNCRPAGIGLYIYTSEVIPYRIISVNLLPDNVWSLAVEMVLNETSTCESIPPLDPVQVSWALLVWDANYQFSL